MGFALLFYGILSYAAKLMRVQQCHYSDFAY